MNCIFNAANCLLNGKQVKMPIVNHLLLQGSGCMFDCLYLSMVAICGNSFSFFLRIIYLFLPILSFI